ncbi:MAG: redoxin domain-containing protein [Pseudolysinimonas sp.]
MSAATIPARLARSGRRIYAEGTVALGLAAVVLTIAQLVSGGSWAWAGVAVAWLPITTYLLYLLIGRPSTRSRHLAALDVVAAAGLIVAVFAGVWPALAAAAGVAATIGYQYWYSRQHVPAIGITVGQPLPVFPLTTLTGERTDSSALRTGPHVIVFYRGNWCPFCMVQVRQLAEQYRELDRRGVRVALISPQRADDTAELATRFEVPMEFFVDSEGAAARALDLVQAGGTPLIYGAGTSGDTVVPTVAITDREGTVIWLEVADNHRVRPEPQTFLTVLDRAGIVAPR